VLIQSVKAYGFEGLVVKRCNSAYEPGLRTGAWMKTLQSRAGVRDRLLHTRTKTLDALSFGYYEGKELVSVAHAHGFTPVMLRTL
jgi:ATP-dependent DNA ligase